jgi:hypothetical protein
LTIRERQDLPIQDLVAAATEGGRKSTDAHPDIGIAFQQRTDGQVMVEPPKGGTK